MADLDGILALRERLRLRVEERAPRGGFLLGCSRERYAFFICRAETLVLERAGSVAGFAIMLPDPVLRASTLWARRGAIGWHKGEEAPPEAARIAYFEQLALCPDAPRLYAPALAFAALATVAEAGHDHLYATTLELPVRNAASLSLLRAVGARLVGSVQEEYEGIGRVVSALHHLRLAGDLAAAIAPPSAARLQASLRRLAA
jgi:hypothetical protein